MSGLQHFFHQGQKKIEHVILDKMHHGPQGEKRSSVGQEGKGFVVHCAQVDVDPHVAEASATSATFHTGVDLENYHSFHDHFGYSMSTAFGIRLIFIDHFGIMKPFVALCIEPCLRTLRSFKRFLLYFCKAEAAE